MRVRASSGSGKSGVVEGGWGWDMAEVVETKVMGSEDRNPISEVGGGKQGVVMEGKDGIVR